MTRARLSPATLVAATLLTLVVVVAAAAPWVAPNPPDQVFADYLYAPPTRVHLAAGLPPSLYIFPLRTLNRLERRFDDDRTRPVRLAWFAGGHLLGVAGVAGVVGVVAQDAAPLAGPRATPLLLLGADAYGRDIFSRLVFGARASLGLAALATLAAVALGAVVGGVAGYAGGVLDNLLSRVSDFVLVLPATYVVLALRAVMPLVLPSGTVFLLLAGIFAAVGWPVVARGVRAIIASERERDYITAGRAAGAGAPRLLLVHLMPAAWGHLATQATLLLPAFILAEATLSFVGLGFPDSVPTWGTMLHDAASTALSGDAPWMLAPAGAIFLVVLAVNLLVQGRGVKSGA